MVALLKNADGVITLFYHLLHRSEIDRFIGESVCRHFIQFLKILCKRFFQPDMNTVSEILGTHQDEGCLRVGEITDPEVFNHSPLLYIRSLNYRQYGSIALFPSASIRRMFH